MVVADAESVTVGVGCTVTFTVCVPVLLHVEPITEYVVLETGETVIELVVAPVFQT
jgi:hypothetical protein